MRTLVVGVALLCACEASRDPVVIEATATYDPTLVTDGVLGYQSFGTFVIKASATVTDPEISINPRTALHATSTIEDVVAVPGATTTASISLAPETDRPGHYSGGGTLVWPPGGPITVLVTVTGASHPVEVKVPLIRPRVAFVYGDGSQNGSTATVPMCIVATTQSGSVTIQLEGAVFVGTTNAAQTLPLTQGMCMVMSPTQVPADVAPIVSHAVFSVATSSTTFIAGATLVGPSGSAQLDAIAPLQLPAPAIISVPLDIAFTAPTDTTIDAGDVVTLQVRVTRAGDPAKNVAVTFQSSPQVDLVPPTATTDAMGHAMTTFAMPDVGNGNLVVGATTGSKTAVVTLSN